MIQHQCLPRHHQNPEASARKAAEKPQLKPMLVEVPHKEPRAPAIPSRGKCVMCVRSFPTRSKLRRLWNDKDGSSGMWRTLSPQRWSKNPKIRVSTKQHDCEDFGCLRKKPWMDLRTQFQARQSVQIPKILQTKNTAIGLLNGRLFTGWEFPVACRANKVDAARLNSSTSAGFPTLVLGHIGMQGAFCILCRRTKCWTMPKYDFMRYIVRAIGPKGTVTSCCACGGAVGEVELAPVLLPCRTGMTMNRASLSLPGAHQEEAVSRIWML